MTTSEHTVVQANENLMWENSQQENMGCNFNHVESKKQYEQTNKTEIDSKIQRTN